MYQQTKHFRKTINRLIDLAKKERYNFSSFQKGQFDLLIGYFEEIELKENMNFPKLETYKIYDSKNEVRYEIFGHRLKNESFIIVELNKWSADGNTFLLNDAVNTQVGKIILEETESIVDQITTQQSDTTHST